MDASLALQTALRARLTAYAPLTSLVPPASILDHSGPSARFPGIVIGEGQTAHAEIAYERDTVRAFLDVHIWTKADDFFVAKSIAGAIRVAIKDQAPWSIADHHLVDLTIPLVRFMRDKESETPLAHGVVQISALLQEIAS